jgi:hypothetical protein
MDIFSRRSNELEHAEPWIFYQLTIEPSEKVTMGLESSNTGAKRINDLLTEPKKRMNLE